MFKRFLTVVFGVMCVGLFASLMFHAVDKYNDHICQVRYGHGDNQTLQALLEHPLVKSIGHQTCLVITSLTREELHQQPSLWEQIWNTITPSESYKYRKLAHEMLEKCGENVLRGPCCEWCVRYRLVMS